MENITSIISILPNFLPYSNVTANHILFLSSSSFIVFISILFLIPFLKLLNQNKSTQLPLPTGPKPWPIVCCLPALLRNKPVFRWIHSVMKELHTKIACFRLGNVHVIVVTCLDISCEFLKVQDFVFANRPITMSSRIDIDGYLTTVMNPYGEQWKKLKRVLLFEMLSHAKHKFFCPKRLEEANQLVRYVYNLCTNPENGGLVDIRFVLQIYGGNLIRNIMLNNGSFGELKNDGEPNIEDVHHVDAFFTLLAHIYSFCVSDYFPCMEIFDFGGHEKSISEAKKTMKRLHEPIIEERIQQLCIGKIRKLWTC